MPNETTDFSSLESGYSERLQQILRSRIATERSFPLQSIILLYTRATRSDVYCQYFEGLKLLVQYLSPIDKNVGIEFRVPASLRTYEMVELAKILGVPEYKIYYCLLVASYGVEIANDIAKRSIR